MKTIDERVEELIRGKAGITAEEIEDILKKEGYDFFPGWILVN